jgi:hypothetical protein
LEVEVDEEREAASEQIIFLKLRQDAIERGMSEMIEQAISKGIRTVVEDPATWDAAFSAMKDGAQRQAGRFTFNFIGALFRKAIFIVGVGMIIYYIGGWALLATWLKGQGH